MNNSKVFELVLKTLPLSNQITDIDLSGDRSIRLSWRGDRFRICGNLGVEKVDDGMLVSDNFTIILERLLWNAK